MAKQKVKKQKFSNITLRLSANESETIENLMSTLFEGTASRAILRACEEFFYKTNTIVDLRKTKQELEHELSMLRGDIISIVNSKTRISKVLKKWDKVYTGE